MKKKSQLLESFLHCSFIVMCTVRMRTSIWYEKQHKYYILLALQTSVLNAVSSVLFFW